jgi:hypothetical protein
MCSAVLRIHVMKPVLFGEILNLKCYSLNTNGNRCHFLNFPSSDPFPGWQSKATRMLDLLCFFFK